jgi:hypothetical protein
MSHLQQPGTHESSQRSRSCATGMPHLGTSATRNTLYAHLSGSPYQSEQQTPHRAICCIIENATEQVNYQFANVRESAISRVDQKSVQREWGLHWIT